MAEIPRSAAFGKLNPILYKGIESATTLCKLRGNPYVELSHWLNQLFQVQDSDLHRIVRHFELDTSRLVTDLAVSLDQLPRGATAISDFATQIMEAIEQAWVYSSLLYRSSAIRGGHLLIGLLKTPNLKNALLAMSSEFRKIKIDALSDQLNDIVAGSPESDQGAKDGLQLKNNETANTGNAPAEMGKQEALAKYAINLSEKARNGELDPITGRDDEIRQIIDILMRRRQNNPILTGEAGVGKTAVVEGFALRVAKGDVPPALKNVDICALDIGLLQAGASMKGEFEARLRQVIDEVQSSAHPIILFIDEAHTLIGAGGAAGTGDAANLLKPALARGTLRTIAATTWDEYKKYFEKDPALTRRFQVVQVQEPSEEKAIGMLRGVAAVLQKHHRVLLLDSALEAAVRLSHRYIPARQLPDKAVSLLDTACARVAVSQHATPPEVEDCQRKISLLEVERDIIQREARVGINVAERQESVDNDIAQEQIRLQELTLRWQNEKRVVDQILSLRADLLTEENASTSDDSESVIKSLAELQAELLLLQGDKPLILPTVDEQAVAAVVQDWTGIPVGRMVKDDIESVLRLADNLNNRVIGQGHAMDMIAKRVQTSRAKLDNPNKPVGVFMLCGTSGVGKTETALALAEALYGGEQNVITINMSEYQEAHTVSTLKGAPPGYVGYGEGGVLTEAVRRKPYSVVLLDEVEKAHPDVHEMFFQVFDKGYMEDGEGRFIDFKNTIILLTSNAGSELIMARCEEGTVQPDPEKLEAELREPLLDIFPAALLGRLVVIPYYPLSQEMLKKIVRLQLNRIKKRVEENHGVEFEYDEDTVQLIVSRCTEVESGGRMVDAILTNTLLPRISHEYLSRLSQGTPLEVIRVSVKEQDFLLSFDL
jgi:type VI secretion system protein VasG